jgi:transaldolase
MMIGGELSRLVDQGVGGVTANPATVAKAITSGSDYERDIERAAAAGQSAPQIYEALVVADIRRACDIVQPVYDEADGRDGFVSLEVSPHLAHDSEASVAEAICSSKYPEPRPVSRRSSSSWSTASMLISRCSSRSSVMQRWHRPI